MGLVFLEEEEDMQWCSGTEERSREDTVRKRPSASQGKKPRENQTF